MPGLGKRHHRRLSHVERELTLADDNYPCCNGDQSPELASTQCGSCKGWYHNFCLMQLYSYSPEKVARISEPTYRWKCDECAEITEPSSPFKEQHSMRHIRIILIISGICNRAFQRTIQSVQANVGMKSCEFEE